VNLIERAGHLEVSCEKSDSGHMAIAFCKYCRAACQLAGKTSDEIQAMLPQ
jgi:hypothetical protein